MAVVGPLDQPDAFYVVIDQVRYVCDSMGKAISLALQIFLGQYFPYPKLCKPAWILLQKTFLKLAVNEKIPAPTSRALTYFQTQLGLALE